MHESYSEYYLKTKGQGVAWIVSGCTTSDLTKYVLFCFGQLHLIHKENLISYFWCLMFIFFFTDSRIMNSKQTFALFKIILVRR